MCEGGSVSHSILMSTPPRLRYVPLLILSLSHFSDLSAFTTTSPVLTPLKTQVRTPLNVRKCARRVRCPPSFLFLFFLTFSHPCAAITMPWWQRRCLHRA